MIKNIKQLFTVNFGWKIFSLLTAMVLWCIVINIKNPIEIKEFPVYIEILGQESLVANNIVLANEASMKSMRVTIKVRGNRLGLDKLKANEKNIIGTVDLQSNMLYSIGKNNVYVDIKLPTIGGEGFEIIGRSIQNIEVMLEKIETVQKPITVELVGTTKEGFVTLKPEHTPSTIQVKGASSVIAKIDKVRAVVNVAGAASNMEVSVEPRVYDSEGTEILGLELSHHYISVKVPINEYKKVPIEGSANQGLLQDGYAVTNIDWEPKFVEVVGSSKEVNAFAELKLPAVSLSGLNKSKEIIYDITTLLPENVIVRTGTPSAVKVTITIEKEIVKQFDIPIENITVSGFTSATLHYELVQKPLELSLIGRSNALDTIDVPNIKGNIDIAKYSEGTYDVPVSFTLPKGVTLVGYTPTVKIIIAPVATTAPVTTTATPHETTSATTAPTTKETQVTSETTKSN